MKHKTPYSIYKSKLLSQHWTLKHGKLVPKIAFKTLQSVLDYMDSHHINKDIYHPYICRECGAWHIGHHKKKNKQNGTYKDYL